VADQCSWEAHRTEQMGFDHMHLEEHHKARGPPAVRSLCLANHTQVRLVAGIETHQEARMGCEPEPQPEFGFEAGLAAHMDSAGSHQVMERHSLPGSLHCDVGVEADSAVKAHVSEQRVEELLFALRV
jgi:hypothetical protein